MSPVAPGTSWTIRVTCPVCGEPLVQTATDPVSTAVLRSTVACSDTTCTYEGRLTVTLCPVRNHEGTPPCSPS